ncbi:MAG: SDR family NAD(P)-dependent oxidoreductase [Hyphomicrobiaceae bacterium]|nr:SDR family NAD(P)-dependent oxidoreductase [Hyphomicrobiaceae bacterium]
MTAPPDLTGRIALVTGASRGIGRAVALALSKAGAHVVISARSTPLLEDLDDEIRAAGGSATILQLDLTKGDRIDAIGPTIYPRWGRLDILVANAGLLGTLSPLPHVTADAWSMVMKVNLEANWRLIRTLDPLLRLSDAGRAVLLTSGASDGHHAYWGPYAVSKAGIEALARTWAAEATNSPLRVNLINPGPIGTQMRAKAFPGENPDTLPTPADIAPLFLEVVSKEQTANGEIFMGRQWLAARNAKWAGRGTSELDA